MNSINEQVHLKWVREQLSDEDRDKLDALVTKWRTVGREIAWLVWDTVRDLEPGTAALGASAMPARGGWDEDENPYNSQGKKTTIKLAESTPDFPNANLRLKEVARIPSLPTADISKTSGFDGDEGRDVKTTLAKWVGTPIFGGEPITS